MFASHPVRRLTSTGLALLALLSAGCADEGLATDAQSADIVAGETAEGYPEAVLVDMRDSWGPIGSCSGTLVAPTVVMTAGHCVDGATSWMIIAPYAGGQWKRATRAEVYDWDIGMNASFKHHDVGVVLLDEPIVLERYPTLAKDPFPHGGEAVAVGRTFEGETPSGGMFDSQPMFVSEPIVLLHHFGPGVEDLHPLLYGTNDTMIERGDSGGPVYAFEPDAVPGASRDVIGVVSMTHYVFRVETLHDWLQAFVDAAP